MQRHPKYTRDRISQLADRLKARVYPESRPITSLQMAGPTPRIPLDEAMQLPFNPAKLGDSLGKLWETFWIKAHIQLPGDWAGQRVDLLWDHFGEATLWIDGKAEQGLNTGHGGAHRDAVLTESAEPGTEIDLVLEAACNLRFGEGTPPFKSRERWWIEQAHIARFDPQAWDLYHDLIVLVELEARLTADDDDPTWAGRLLGELNRFANTIDEDDPTTWDDARQILTDLHQTRTAGCVHELSAIGHAHIDTAWKWPLEESYRKCVRSFSTATRLMDDYSDYRFACSQAFQYQWVKDRNPDLYNRIQEKIAAGQWVPVGGSWIEPDCNLPSGESLCRQFLYGQRFFEAELGGRVREFWNPDVFGYNGQLPQIMRQSGIHRFLTQKLSWNRYNKPEHHTFTWRGVDGSEVLAHFPPNDNYNSEPDVKSLRFNVTNHKDHDRNAHSYMLFGYGDGGGGPTREMLERIARAGDLQGLPRTHMRSAEQFFDLLENAVSDRPMIVGELYFEYHRGTYTTQADTKRNNRKAEWLLHDLELLAALADRVIGRADYPRQAIDDAWKLVLLNQFHDILPGSSIGEVYHDASEDYQRVFEICEPLAQQAGERLAAALASPPSQGGAGGGSPVPDANGPSPLNTLGVPRRELMTTPTGDLVPVEAPAMGFGMVVDAPAPVRLQRSGEAYVLSNEHLTATVQPDGTISHLAEVGAPGEAVIDGRAHVLELFDDRPTAYDAWDIDPFALETRREAPPAHTCEVMREDSLRVELRYERDLGQGSTMTQVVRLDAGSRRLEVDCEVDWHASHTLLKVAFPTTIQARNTTCEMQWHTVDRPTHRNTSFDQAMFEVPAHRWVDLSQPGLGVALLSESKYGFSFEDQTIKMTLLRSPKSPDPDADMGRHQFSYALMPHAGDWRAADVTGEGLRFNQPMRWIDHAPANVSLASVDHPALVLDTIKKAEETEATVLRLYESYGTRGEATVKLNVPFESAVRCNFLEDDGDAVDVTDGSLRVSFEPWQVISIKVR